MAENKPQDLTKIPEDIMSEEQFKAGKGKGNVFIGTLNVAMRPAQALTAGAKSMFESRYRGKYRRAKTLFYVDMALLGLIAVLLIVVGFLYFFKPSIADKIDVQTSIIPEEVISGKEVGFLWVYRNDSEMILDNVTWSFTMPNNFEIANTAPVRSDPLKNVIDLGTLPPGGEGRVKINGRAWGAVGDSQTIWANLSFVQAENGKREQKVVTTSYLISDSVLHASLTAPEKIINNQEIDLKIGYENRAREDLKGVEIHAYWPAGFQFLSSELALVDNVWHVGDLEPGAGGEIEIKGYLASPDDFSNFYFETYSLVGEDKVRQEVLAAQSQIVPPQLQVVAEINEEYEPALSWGDKMDLAVSYTNIGQFDLGELGFAVEIDPYFVDTSRFSGFEFKDGKFYFTQEVESVGPGETKQLSGTLYLKSSPDFSQFEVPKDITVNFAIESTYRVGGEEQTALYKTGRTTIKMKSPFWAQFFARYWAETGDQLGRGPIPPRVGRATKYWVFWSMGKTTNDLSNIFLQAQLPANVSYTGLSSVTVGDSINYNPDTNIITWSLRDLESTMVGPAQTVALSFEVEVVPTPDQAGSAANLVDWMKMTARDEFTEGEVSYTAGPITTILTADDRAKLLGGTVR